MKVAIVGTGYVGLVTGACLSEVGIEVTCIDVDLKKIENLKKGILPIYEPGLEELVERNFKKGRLNFSTEISESISGAEVLFIAVGTPPGEDGSADLQYVLKVAKDVGEHMDNHLVVVTKSTVPVGTAEKVREQIAQSLANRNSDLEFDIASNPEFLKEGAAVDDFMKPDRIIVGVESDRAKAVMERLYRPFTLNGHPVIMMDIPSAEMTKYAANAMLATKISFMNDVANLCEIMGADVNAVRKGIGSDPRIGSKFIYPGIGYGGSCFPKDVKALARTARENGHAMRILEAVEEVNDDQKRVLTSKLRQHFGDLKGKHFAMWGLSFKPQTDDMREAPSLVIIDEILKAGGTVTAYDPVAMEEAKHLYLGDTIGYAADEYEALKDADALLLVTEWADFRLPDWNRIQAELKSPVLFDGRNLYDRERMKDLGFTYYGIGV